MYVIYNILNSIGEFNETLEDLKFFCENSNSILGLGFKCSKIFLDKYVKNKKRSIEEYLNGNNFSRDRYEFFSVLNYCYESYDTCSNLDIIINNFFIDDVRLKSFIENNKETIKEYKAVRPNIKFTCFGDGGEFQ